MEFRKLSQYDQRNQSDMHFIKTYTKMIKEHSKVRLDTLKNFVKDIELVPWKFLGNLHPTKHVIQKHFRDYDFQNLIKDYCNEQIYNADESGLNYAGLPNTTLAYFDESVSCFKLNKNRITLMMCANAAGDYKLPLVFINKYANPRGFTTINSNGKKTDNWQKFVASLLQIIIKSMNESRYLRRMVS